MLQSGLVGGGRVRLQAVSALCRRRRSLRFSNSATRFLTSPPVPRHRCFSGLRAGPIGFIGLGNMGSCMAKSLVRHGHDVIVLDADSSKAKTLAAETGATAISSVKEMAAASYSIITMLPNTPNVEAVYLGDVDHPREGEGVKVDSSLSAAAMERGDDMRQGLLDLVQPGTLLVDSSTIDPLASRRINATATSKGITMLDAPVSGGVLAAADGTLTFMCGGTDEGMQRARPLLMSMGTKAVHCGEAGTGCTTKVCNNLALAISMIGVAEAMSLGSRMGMDPKVLASVLNSSTARCWSSEAYNPCPGVMENVPSSRGFEGGFAASLMEKDLHLALQAARESSQPLPMGAHAHQLYSLLCSQGSPHKDFSSIYELISRRPNE